ncbi:hypothetical protein [Sphingobacterium sp. HMA12]|uniref:hypothetical protein n=1 Tax=Sphingobacterium sp. HMA12 TaxID=2050894 RepID=UPI000CEA680E|nr:hypothetical protein [Sphingobacterium sp. HMA12]
MHIKFKFAIALVTGAALILFKRHAEKVKNRKQEKKAKNKSRSKQPSKPVGYRPFKDLASEINPDIVAMQHADPQVVTDNKHVPNVNSPQHVAYHQKGNRHH